MSRTILVVHSMPRRAKALLSSLEDKGYTAQVQTSAEDALAWLAEGGTCHLVLSEIVLPGMDGFSLCDALKGSHALKGKGGPGLPFFFVTASDRIDDLMQGLAAGADCFLPLSIGEEEIVDRVKRLLEGGDAMPPTGLSERVRQVVASCSGEQGSNRLAMALHDLAVARDCQPGRWTEPVAGERLEAFLLSAMDAMPSNVAILDLRGEIVATNTHWADFAAANDESHGGMLRGQNYLQQCESPTAGERALAIAAAIRSVLSGETASSQLEYRWDGLGRERWFSARITRFAHEGEGFLMVTQDDVSLRVKSEHGLQEQRRLLLESVAHQQLVFDNVPIYAYSSPVCETEAGLTFSPPWLSDNVAAVTGLSTSDYCSCDAWLKTIVDEDKPRLVELFGAIAAGVQDTWDLQYRVRRPDSGELRWMQAQGRVLRDASGSAVQGLGIGIDITTQKNLELERFQSQGLEALGMLAGGIAHDFNNLLTTIVSYAGFIDADLEPSSIHGKDVREILEAAERATLLTRGLLAFSMRQPTATRVFDLGQHVVNLESILARTLEEGRCELSTSVGRSAICIDGNPDQVTQVLIHLAANARDAMPEGGRLSVECEIVTLGDHNALILGLPRGSYARLSVTDNGTGMDATTKARIFEPFFTTKAHPKGSGLGLAACYGIIKQMRGNMHFTTEPGVGTCCEVFLPTTDRSPLPEPVVVKPLRSHGLRIRTILVVEDNDAIRAMMVRSLTSEGFKALSASDGAEGLRVFNEEDSQIDMVVSDVLLPKLTGYQLAERVLLQAPGLPILLTSGYTGSAVLDGNRLMNLPMLWKPYSGATFASKVIDVLASAARGPATSPADEVSLPVDSKGRRHRVLLIDDDAMIRSALHRILKRVEFDVVEAGTLAESRSLMEGPSEFSAIICDLHLPDGSGKMLYDWIVAERPLLAERLLFLTGGVTSEEMSRFVEEQHRNVIYKPVHARALIERVQQIAK